ncbi:GEVED domain-containing protein [Flavobacterium sp.]|uniref:GEVED domain-containing protein n=1 Tax=Flavobacterium sp. TaxID=239 RepID=UPI00286C148A|nr:GEVED domain-containing protein [Flavobacterium sp.]
MKKITLVFFLFVLNSFSSHAQSVAEYIFSQSTEDYTPVVGTNSAAVGDDGSQNSIPIGFDFIYGGVTYTTFSVNTNGFIRLGNAIGGQSWTNLLSLTAVLSPLIAPFWDDHNRNGGSIQYAVSGTAPDRVLEIGWDNINIGGNGGQSTTAFGSFKMRLFETTGQIEFVYGPTMNSAGAFSASIGLNDLNAFLSVSPDSATATSSIVTANNNIASTQFLLGQKFTFMPGEHCNGAPTPGNTVSNFTSVCASYAFNLSLENQTTGFGVTYQWQTSSDGVTFSDIVGATNSVYITTQTAATTYQCIVTCSDVSATSNPVEVLMNDTSQCYCAPTYTNGKTDGDLISNVTINGTTLANDTGNAPVNPYFTYFVGQPNYTASLQIGQTYDINVTVGTFGQQNVAVWIDFNDDGIFSLNENVGTSSEIAANATGTFPIVLDCNATSGLHRMRIRDVWNTVAIDPCTNYGYGETEDYNITIEDGFICQAPHNLDTGNITGINAELTWTPACTQIGWDVHLALAGEGPPVGNPSNPNSNNPLLVTNLTPLTNYEFYVRSICSETESSSWAGPYTFTTLPPAIANDECDNAVALIPGMTFSEHAIIASNIGATKTIGPPNPTCASLGFGGDVWFSTVVPGDGKITIEVQANPGSPFADSGMNAFIGTCDNLTVIGCSDDEGVGAFSRLNLTGLTPGETIYARVWEYGNNVHGAFQVSAWSPTLSNNNFDKSNFKYYPNPVKDYLNLSYSELISKVIIYNMLGQEVLVQSPNVINAKIDVNALPTGSYLVKVYSNNLQNTIKINKE